MMNPITTSVLIVILKLLVFIIILHSVMNLLYESAYYDGSIDTKSVSNDEEPEEDSISNLIYSVVKLVLIAIFIYLLKEEVI